MGSDVGARDSGLGVRRATPHRFPATWVLWLLVTGLWACASGVGLPDVDLEEPGWKVWTAQALWTRQAGAPPVAGEVIAARRTVGEVFVSFSKPPLPLFSARTLGGQWRIDLVEGDRSRSGRGRPPKRFVWFDLPAILDGGSPRGNWTAEQPAAGEWLISNPTTGEIIKLVLDP